MHSPAPPHNTHWYIYMCICVYMYKYICIHISSKFEKSVAKKKNQEFCFLGFWSWLGKQSVFLCCALHLCGLSLCLLWMAAMWSVNTGLCSLFIVNEQEVRNSPNSGSTAQILINPILSIPYFCWTPSSTFSLTLWFCDCRMVSRSNSTVG